MRIEELLDMMDDIVDRAWGVPLSSGRCVIDAEKVRELIDDIRLNLPSQLKNAKAIVENQEEILYNAQKEADMILKRAEDRARVLISKEEVVKQAQSVANEIVSTAQGKAKTLRNATQDFSDTMMRQTEESLLKSLNDVRATRQALKTTYRQHVTGAKVERAEKPQVEEGEE